MPAADSDFRQRIAAALAAFASQQLHAASLGFFNALGYNSERRLRIEPATPQHFLATLAPDRVPGQAALLADWQSAEFVFQLTTDEVRSLAQGAFNFGNRGAYDANTFDSYLFVAVQLAQPRYTRTQLAGVVREINRLFPQPTLVLLRHGDTVSLGIVHRRPGKRDTTRDVLEKVTLIMDIRAGAKDSEPLRAHVDILSEFSLDELQADYPFHDFTGLHKAWEQRLATYQLNEQFYRDIANWYFWALKPDTGIVYPRDVRTEEERSIFLIRLLTRLIFCWFLQEKGLIPRNLFRRHVVDRLLKDASPKAGTYYRAVLQNLFFATLNQEMDKRGFRRKSEKKGQRDGNRGVTGLFRYAALLADADALTAHLAEIPFLNGGLFDCLDRVYTSAEKKAHNAEDVRLDDFSEEKSNALHLPNDLFFGPDRLVNLTHIYADPKKAPKRPIEENVAGLITILSRYKFTVVENTPFEEEIALDPELLGKVFENLLASYNEDTRTTARKATGSFYTPREIVSYMVDEALRAYLKSEIRNPKSEIEEQLRQLFDPSVEMNPFDENDTVALIAAIDRVKILDPACGSGAFPMGALHRLTDLLAKLDPNNRRWKEQQLRKVERDRQLAAQMEDEELRQATLAEADDRAADIQRSFDTRFHDLDFARKLYLIENCIYGVDIQPIATQIAKLRFFIALIVDQRHDPAAPNRGVRPLPNLETKLVAADFLIPIERRETQFQLFDEKADVRRRIEKLKQELAFIRHEHFGARDPRKKERCRAEDARLREEMAGLLRQTGMSAPQARDLAGWDPYDQNAHASFFDADWMFNLTRERERQALLTLRSNFSFLNETTGQMELPAGGREIESGFDVVLGNPPYIRFQTLKQKSPKIADFLKAHYVSASKGNFDLYVVFVEAGMQSLKSDGNLAYILPHKFFNAEYGEPLRGLLAKGKHLHEIVHFGDQQVFPGATNYVCLLFLHKAGCDTFRFVRADVLAEWLKARAGTERRFTAKQATAADWNFAVGGSADIFDRLSAGKRRLGQIAERISQGIRTSANEIYVLDVQSENGAVVLAHSKQLDGTVTLERKAVQQFLAGREIKAYTIQSSGKVVVMPYRISGTAATLIPERELRREFPKAFDYLLRLA
jgi:type I restriction-modification system DNA methylase subunit